MADRNYYVFRDDNCKFEAMTKEQIIAAIAEATGVTPSNIDDAFITKIKEQNRQNNLKFWIGTQAEYNTIQNPEPNTFYIFSDSNEMADIEQMIDTVAQEKANEAIEAYAATFPERNKVLYIGNEIPTGAFTAISIPELTRYSLVKVYVLGHGPVVCCVECSIRGNGRTVITGVGRSNIHTFDDVPYMIHIYLEGEYDEITYNGCFIGEAGASLEQLSAVKVNEIVGLM